MKATHAPQKPTNTDQKTLSTYRNNRKRTLFPPLSLTMERTHSTASSSSGDNPDREDTTEEDEDDAAAHMTQTQHQGLLPLLCARAGSELVTELLHEMNAVSHDRETESWMSTWYGKCMSNGWCE